jgi:hypothetical protein
VRDKSAVFSIDLKGKKTSADGFIVICNSDAAKDTYGNNKCDYIIPIDVSIGDKISILRGTNPASFDEVVDEYDSSSLNVDEMDTAGGRVVRKTSITEPKSQWNEDDWFIELGADEKLMIPQQWWNVTEVIIITEVADPVNGGRFVELYAKDYADPAINAENRTIEEDELHLVVFESASNDPSWNTAIDLKGAKVSSHGYIVFCSVADESLFNGTCNNPIELTDNQLLYPFYTNGDDQIAIVQGSESKYSIRDIFGVPGVDGTDKDHEFTDGHAVRKTYSRYPEDDWNKDAWTIKSPVQLSETHRMNWISNECNYEILITEIAEPKDLKTRFMELLLEDCRSFTIERDIKVKTNGATVSLRGKTTSSDGYIVLCKDPDEFQKAYEVGFECIESNTLFNDDKLLEVVIDDTVVDAFHRPKSFLNGRAVRKSYVQKPTDEDDWIIENSVLPCANVEMDPFAWPTVYIPPFPTNLTISKAVLPSDTENFFYFTLHLPHVTKDAFEKLSITTEFGGLELKNALLTDINCSRNEMKKETLKIDCCIQSNSLQCSCNDMCQADKYGGDESGRRVLETGTKSDVSIQLQGTDDVGNTRRRLQKTKPVTIDIFEDTTLDGGNTRLLQEYQPFGAVRNTKYCPSPTYKPTQWILLEDLGYDLTYESTLNISCAYDFFITEIVKGDFIELFTGATLSHCPPNDRIIKEDFEIAIDEGTPLNLKGMSVSEDGFLLLCTGSSNVPDCQDKYITGIDNPKQIQLRNNDTVVDQFISYCRSDMRRELGFASLTTLMSNLGHMDTEPHINTESYSIINTCISDFERASRVKTLSYPTDYPNENYTEHEWLNCTNSITPTPGEWGDDDDICESRPSSSPSAAPTFFLGMPSALPSNIPSASSLPSRLPSRIPSLPPGVTHPPTSAPTTKSPTDQSASTEPAPPTSAPTIPYPTYTPGKGKGKGGS